MKQTELHRHLDVSMRPSTLLQLAQERGLEPQSTSLEAFRSKLILTRPLQDLESVLACFQLCQKVLDRPEVLEKVAYEVVEDCYQEGTRRVELRFSPSFAAEFSGLKWEEVLMGFDLGIKKACRAYPEMEVGLICIASRDYGPQAVDETVDFYLKNRSSFVGVDLAGNEAQFPCRLYEKSFKKALKQGGKITVHAGEGSGPENIWEAIELLGASRIGHGISCVNDPKLMDLLNKKRIMLEMCPTSNWLTRSVTSFESHPLPQVLRAEIPVSINTDDPTIFGVTLKMEQEVCRTRMGLSAQEVQTCTRLAYENSFLN